MDMEYHLDGANARAEESLLNTLAQANAGAFHGLYGYAEYLAKQQLPDTADVEWLTRWAVMLDVPRLEATTATGYATATGDGLLPANTVLIDPLTRLTYKIAADRVISATGTTNSVPITAMIAGYSSNLAVGTLLQLQSPVQGIAAQLTITSLGGGAEQESIESWRSRVSRKLSERARIGDEDDYAYWAESAHPAIYQAWVYPNEGGLGSVVIRCMGAGVDPLLDEQVLAQASQSLDRIRNVGAHVTVVNVDLKTVTIILAVPDSDPLKLAIRTELEQLFLERRKQSALLREVEIDAAILKHTTNYTLISPKMDMQCTETEVLALEGITWL